MVSTGAVASEIKVTDATVHYPDKESGARRIVLNDISLNVRGGEFVTVVGPSGCGKSTLLRLVLGSQFPNEGSVAVDSKPVEQVCRERGIVYQKYSLFPHVTVRDNIALGPVLEETSIPSRAAAAAFFFLPKKLRNALPLKYFRSYEKWGQEADQMLERIGLTVADGRKYPHELSGGMRQRVAIGQSLIMKPKVLLMDEPFGALDHTTREDMQLFLLEQWAEHKMTVFFVTHDLAEAVYLGTRLIGVSQFYTDSNGARGVGARIVTDIQVPGNHPKPHDYKYSKEFSALVQELQRRVLDPNHLQHIRDFNRTHQDAEKEVGGVS